MGPCAPLPESTALCDLSCCVSTAPYTLTFYLQQIPHCISATYVSLKVWFFFFPQQNHNSSRTPTELALIP